MAFHFVGKKKNHYYHTGRRCQEVDDKSQLSPCQADKHNLKKNGNNREHPCAMARIHGAA